MDFLIDTGATYSVPNTRLPKLPSEKMLVTGGSGESLQEPFLQPLN